MNKNIVVAFVVLVIIGVVVWYSGMWGRLWQKPIVTSNDEVDSEILGHSVETGDGAVSGFARLAENALYVAEQRPGKEIIVTIVNLASPGYVVIHEFKNEKAGTILGNSALIEKAEGKNIKVSLNRLVKDGEELVAMLHTEKGGVGFDLTTDLPVRDAFENIIHMEFQVSDDAPDPSAVEVMF